MMKVSSLRDSLWCELSVEFLSRDFVTVGEKHKIVGAGLPPCRWYAGIRPVPLETGAAVLAEPAADRTVKRSRACHGECRTPKTGNATPPVS
jgi:hypothetical protein